MAHAVQHDHHIHQMDVNTAYLNAKLVEEVYMTPPKGYRLPTHLIKLQELYPSARIVCRLNHTINGLKQSTLEWFLTIDGFVIALCFIKCTTDGNVYRLRNSYGYVILAIYIDDLIISANSLSSLIISKLPLQPVLKYRIKGPFIIA